MDVSVILSYSSLVVAILFSYMTTQHIIVQKEDISTNSWAVIHTTYYALIVAYIVLLYIVLFLLKKFIFKSSWKDSLLILPTSSSTLATVLCIFFVFTVSWIGNMYPSPISSKGLTTSDMDDVEDSTKHTFIANIGYSAIFKVVLLGLLLFF